jgi:hypothetical protein
MVVVVMDCIVVENELFQQSFNWVVMSCAIYTMSCKANCKTPIFFIVFLCPLQVWWLWQICTCLTIKSQFGFSYIFFLNHLGSQFEPISMKIMNWTWSLGFGIWGF